MRWCTSSMGSLARMARWKVGGRPNINASETSIELSAQKSQSRLSFVFASNDRPVTPNACSIRHAVVSSIQQRLGVWKSCTCIAKRLDKSAS